MADEDNELQERVCRACGEPYRYPVRHSPATRFHCASCAGLPADVRAMFEKYNRRIKALAVQLERLEQRCRAPEHGSAEPRPGR
ncbi:MAG: hypothetical protein HY718_09830 [Planctomycetes bacterium]|nr:hypothetical protein [Planctomycetota bacterium]